MSSIELPYRRDLQSLDGYVRENLERLEQELLAGVPYKSLGEATRVAGFSTLAARSLRSSVHRARKRRPPRSRVQTPKFASDAWLNRTVETQHTPGQPEDDSILLARRLRQLVRSPRPGTDEQDLLV
jgi:hypothetical protein